eukprot:156489-Karenia_brevis.AAC.1
MRPGGCLSVNSTRFGAGHRDRSRLHGYLALALASAALNRVETSSGSNLSPVSERTCSISRSTLPKLMLGDF